jgi:hypothetical protein
LSWGGQRSPQGPRACLFFHAIVYFLLHVAFAFFIKVMKRARRWPVKTSHQLVDRPALSLEKSADAAPGQMDGKHDLFLKG